MLLQISPNIWEAGVLRGLGDALCRVPELILLRLEQEAVLAPQSVQERVYRKVEFSS